MSQIRSNIGSRVCEIREQIRANGLNAVELLAALAKEIVAREGVEAELAAERQNHHRFVDLVSDHLESSAVLEARRAAASDILKELVLGAQRQHLDNLEGWRDSMMQALLAIDAARSSGEKFGRALLAKQGAQGRHKRTNEAKAFTLQLWAGKNNWPSKAAFARIARSQLGEKFGMPQFSIKTITEVWLKSPPPAS